MAWFRSRNTSPNVFSISGKYSCGLTRTNAPVGQFSSHEYAGRLAFDGFSGVPSHRLHLMAIMSSASAMGAGSGALRLNRFPNRLVQVGFGLGTGSRGIIVIAS